MKTANRFHVPQMLKISLHLKEQEDFGHYLMNRESMLHSLPTVPLDMHEFDKPNAFRYVKQWTYLYIQFFLPKRKEKERPFKKNSS